MPSSVSPGPWSFILYVVLQLFFLLYVGGKGRYWLAAPIPVMAFVLFGTAIAYAEKSNLWPIGLILYSQVAVIYLVVVGCWQGLSEHQ